MTKGCLTRRPLIIPSPGIPLTMPFIKSAREKGVPVKGELDIFAQYNTTPVIAITATNGKNDHHGTDGSHA